MRRTPALVMTTGLTALAACAGGGGGGAADYVPSNVGAFEVFANDPIGAGPILEVVTERTATGFTRQSSNVAVLFRLDGAGLSVLGTRSIDATGALTALSDYDPPLPVLPADPGPGATRTVTTTLTTAAGSSSQTRTVTVERLEQVTVPAGTFQALRVKSQASGQPTFSVSWWVAGVGRVKTATFDVTAPDGPPVGSGLALVDAGHTAQPSGALDGFNVVNTLACHGAAVDTTAGGWVMPGGVQRVEVAGTLAVSSATEAGAGCLVMQPMELGFPDATTLTLRRRPFVCVPSAAACAAYAVARLGQDVCGRPWPGGEERYGLEVTGAGAGAHRLLTRVGGGECAAAGLAPEPLAVDWFHP